MKKEEQTPFNTNPILIRLRPFFESGQRIIDLSLGAPRSKVRGARIILIFDDGKKRWIWLKCPLGKLSDIFKDARCLVIERAKLQSRR